MFDLDELLARVSILLERVEHRGEVTPFLSYQLECLKLEALILLIQAVRERKGGDDAAATR